MSVNKCFFEGYIYFGKDPATNQAREKGELKPTQGGHQYMRFTLRVDKRKDAQGNKVDPNWVDMIVWDKQAETIQQHFKKGDPIFIECRYDQNKSQPDQNNAVRVYHDFVVTGFEFVLSAGSQGQNGQGQGRPAPGQPQSSGQTQTSGQTQAPQQQAPPQQAPQSAPQTSTALPEDELPF